MGIHLYLGCPSPEAVISQHLRLRKRGLGCVVLTKSLMTSLLALSQNKTTITKTNQLYCVFKPQVIILWGFLGRRGDENVVLECSSSLSHIRTDTPLKHDESTDIPRAASLSWGSELHQGKCWWTHTPLSTPLPPVGKCETPQTQKGVRQDPRLCPDLFSSDPPGLHKSLSQKGTVLL